MHLLSVFSCPLMFMRKTEAVSTIASDTGQTFSSMNNRAVQRVRTFTDYPSGHHITLVTIIAEQCPLEESLCRECKQYWVYQ